MNALFRHDCDACVFLGTFGPYDLYLCPNKRGLWHSVIGRYGSDGPSYASSGLDENSVEYFGTQIDHPLAETWKRAQALGYTLRGTP